MTAVKTKTYLPNSCPICGEAMYHFVDREEAGILEEKFECPKGHYTYHYLHGYTAVNVGGLTWGWAYSDPFPEVYKKMQAATAYETKLKEQYDKTKH